MRLYIKISRTERPIDFNYQPLLTGCIHKWIGRNNLQHGKLSLYSFSWLQNVDVGRNGIRVRDGSAFTMSFYNDDLAKNVISKILVDPIMFFGAKVSDIDIQPIPAFSEKERFFLASPVLIKRHKDFNETHYTFSDEHADEYLTETLKSKAGIAGLDTEKLKVYFDKSYSSPKTKIISYKGIQNKVNICPVIVEGSPELVEFAWHVGLGNSTGIGFGALK
ncbi:CRISPR-associated endoribonuclease Cas6 [uncultured Proteiniphilum sp.]|uniref:CRISPR-associated endoribonuclease Cas6 n=1 Tax=uncultured Proteiniphilum sp. TaxID=497637 RepID=UPI0026179D1F|nr:CRISPR-associated endoribonuclease Cas6 [uncultured Proteiniphilum sp.]